MISILLVSFFTFWSDADKQNYVEHWKALAIIESQRTGIPASIILGQAILESSYGKSKLAQSAKNHFGIKCKRSWNGSVFYIKDDDKNEKGQLIDSCFRSYDNDMDSFIDHSHFLMKDLCYKYLLDFDKKEYKKWAFGIQDCGYATDKKYALKLIHFIENHRLFELDQ